MSRHAAPEPALPDGLTTHRLIKLTLGIEQTNFSGNGGLGGSCYGCPFSEGPLDEYSGQPAEYSSYANDPSEAFFSCSLPTRTPSPETGFPNRRIKPGIFWGEYAPCTTEEWGALLLQVIPDVPVPNPDREANQ